MPSARFGSEMDAVGLGPGQQHAVKYATLRPMTGAWRSRFVVPGDLGYGLLFLYRI